MPVRRSLAVLAVALAFVTCKKDHTAPVIPGAIVKLAGDGQTGAAGVALGTGITVQVNTSGGAPVKNATVNFVVTQGGGSVSAPSMVTGVNGQTAAVTWTLGQTAGAVQQLTVSVQGAAVSTTFGATAVAGPAANVILQAGNGQSATTGAAVPVAPSVRVRDQFNNSVANAIVTFAVTGGGGSVGGPVDTTGSNGIATVGSWTLGGSGGANTLTATVTGGGITGNPVTFTATAIAATVSINAGNSQTGLVGFAVNVPPSVVLLDNVNAPVVGASVTFAPASGGGSVTGGTTTTNAQGIATVGSWVLGSGPGANTLTATVTGSGITNNPITFNATGQAAGYSITLQYLVPVSAAVQAAFDSAKAKWERIIYGDVPDVSLTLAAGACGSNSPALNSQAIDDILIFVTIDSIDGPGKTLGQAGPCNPVRGGSLLIVVGKMTFDSADVATFLGQGLFDEIALHEMGHVLGFGTLWAAKALLVGPSVSGGLDPHFIGTQSIAAFDRNGGQNYVAGAKVPVENTCPQGVTPPCPGTQDGHWRESVFDTELLTGILDAGVSNPLSVISGASMQDLGYTVNFAGTDVYVVANPLTAAAGLAPRTLGHWDEVLQLPYFVTIDAAGRITGTIRPR